MRLIFVFVVVISISYDYSVVTSLNAEICSDNVKRRTKGQDTVRQAVSKLTVCPDYLNHFMWRWSESEHT